MMQNETTVGPRGGRWFWPAWGAAFLGFPIAGAAATALVGPIGTVGAAAVAGAAAGGEIGATQWLVLRRRLPLSPLWALATAGAMAIGMALGHALLSDDTAPLPLLLRGLVTGAAIGAAQASVLRGVLRAPAIWAAFVTLGWPLGWAVSAAIGLDLAQKWAVFGASGSLAFQLAAGLTLASLRRRPAHVPAPAPVPGADGWRADARRRRTETLLARCAEPRAGACSLPHRVPLPTSPQQSPLVVMPAHHITFYRLSMQTNAGTAAAGHPPGDDGRGAP